MRSFIYIMNNYTVTIANSLDKSLIKEWNNLWDKSKYAHYFNSYPWFMTCSKVFGYKKYDFLLVRKQKKLIALLPLIQKKRFGGVIYTTPGEGYIDRSALLVEQPDENVLMVVFDRLMRRGSFILPEITHELKKALEKNKNLAFQQSGLNFYLPFEKNPLRYLDKKQRKKIEKVLKLHGKELSFETKKGDVKAFKKTLAVDLKSYRESKKIGTFRNPQNLRFFKKLIEINKENVYINILYFKKIPISYELGIRSKDAYYGLNKSFDNSFRHLIPGKVIAYFLMQELHRDGIKEFDFCRGEDMIKKSLTPYSRTQYHLYYLHNFVQKTAYEISSKAKNVLLHTPVLYKTYRTIIYKFL